MWFERLVLIRRKNLTTTIQIIVLLLAFIR